MEDIIKVKKRRNRRSNNCVPCRQRKKQCDRRVPECSTCRQRDEVHLCQWGDERDDAINVESPIRKKARIESSSSSEILRRSFTVEDSSNLLDTLSRADADASPAATSLYSQATTISTRPTIPSKQNRHQIPSTCILNCQQAKNLIYCFQEHAKLRKLIDKWEKEAFDTLEEISMFHNPTLIGIQCMAVHQFHLAHLNSGHLHTRRTDEMIRASRRMGLDHLGSPQDDEDIWTRIDQQMSMPPPLTQTGYWASDTLRARNRKARNDGRALWTFCLAKDWACARISGSCGIDPHSYTTSPPKVYPSGPSGVTIDDAIMWNFIASASNITYEICILCTRADAVGARPDYDQILQLDAKIMSELEKRPDWLRPELWSATSLSKRENVRSYDAILVSCTFWQRLFALHRPFLALSRSEPEKYGLSSSRSYDYAILCIRFMREGLQEGILILKQPGFHHRLLQAALVVIAHLFLSNDLDLRETIAIHQELQFAISAIKALDVADDQGYFRGQGEKLETLMAISARIKLDNHGTLDQHKGLLKNRDQIKTSQMMSSQGMSVPILPGHEDLFTHLDGQLMRISQAWPIGPEEMNFDNIWQDVISLLEPSVTSQQ